METSKGGTNLAWLRQEWQFKWYEDCGSHTRACEPVRSTLTAPTAGEDVPQRAQAGPAQEIID